MGDCRCKICDRNDLSCECPEIMEALRTENKRYRDALEKNKESALSGLDGEEWRCHRCRELCPSCPESSGILNEINDTATEALKGEGDGKV